MHTLKPLIISTLSIALVCMILLTACSVTPPSKSDAAREANLAISHLVRWTDDSNGISFNYPRNWSAKKTTKFDILTFQILEGLVFGRASIANVKNETLETIASLYSKMGAHILGQRCPLTMISQTRIQVGKKPAIKTIVTYQSPFPGSQQQKGMQVVVLNKDTCYIFNFEAPSTLYEEFSSLWQQILNSVQFSW